jgi:hypothetical protein
MPGQHDYTSTACLHGQCGSCRQTCKYCDASCQHGCHTATGLRTVAWVDQARGVARQMFAVLPMRNMPVELFQRIGNDPDLFWLRGEEVPPGTWRNDAGPV